MSRTNSGAQLRVIPASGRASPIRGRLIPYFQPRIRLADGAVTGFEALARRLTDDGDVLPPARFLSDYATAAGKTELLLSMLDAVLQLAAQWRWRGVDLPVSLNIDAAQLCEPTFAETIFSLAAHYPGCLARLHFELLESGQVECYEATNATIRALRSHGMRFHLDDFGAGYATPLHLKRLAISTVKLDREFVQGIPTSDADRTVVSALIAIARAFGCSVVAEGVETGEILEALAALGCDEAQGYAIARPMPGDEVLGWIRRSGRALCIDAGGRCA
jgi:EAL domain-containing protein (putative c-di-GMP-specific phosphodiesterase class I)